MTIRTFGATSVLGLFLVCKHHTSCFSQKPSLGTILNRSGVNCLLLKSGLKPHFHGFQAKTYCFHLLKSNGVLIVQCTPISVECSVTACLWVMMCASPDSGSLKKSYQIQYFAEAEDFKVRANSVRCLQGPRKKPNSTTCRKHTILQCGIVFLLDEKCWNAIKVKVHSAVDIPPHKTK